MLLNILEQSLLFFPLSMGIYLSYRVLQTPDLTTDGSFLLGAAIYALTVRKGVSPAAACAIASLSGCISGTITACLHNRFRINILIGGILMTFILNTLALKLMGRPNLSLLNYPSIFHSVEQWFPCCPSQIIQIALLLTWILLIYLLLNQLLSSPIGLMLYAVGNNPTLVSLSGKKRENYQILALSISNGLVAHAGSLTAQIQGYADISMGAGMILIALATVIIGKQIYLSSTQRPILTRSSIQLFYCFLGVFIYFSLTNIFLVMGIDPLYSRLAIALSLIALLIFNKEEKKKA